MEEYRVPDPETQPIQCLVLAYKTTKGIEYDNREWDKIHFRRSTKAAKELFDICSNLRDADKCLLELATKFNDSDCTWTLETIVKHAHEWVSKQNGGHHGQQRRARFFKALNERGRSGQSYLEGPELKQISNPIRSLGITEKADEENNHR
jgi:hypothetical protein